MEDKFFEVLGIQEAPTGLVIIDSAYVIRQTVFQKQITALRVS